jgi:chromosomal replication initiator protein
VHVANPFICAWMMKRFRTQLTAAAVRLLGPSAGFTVHVDATLGEESRSDNGQPKSVSKPPATGSDHPAAVDKSPSGNVRAHTPQEPTSLATRQPARRRFKAFHSFVSGPCNELALMAAQQISEAPGERFNPLFVHGTTGVGKSHLLESVYSEIRKLRPELNVLFLTSESFTNYFTQALASRSVPSFRQRFRNVDVLLVDNIEFLGNKNATQEEFLHTIDQLMDHGGQLALSCDRHPRLLTKHREELTARFVGGLVCRIEAPAECTRRKLVESLALPYRGQLSPGALNYVACHGGRTAREIQGSINCLVSYANLRRARVTTSQARTLLSGLRDECHHLVRISDVERVVCEAFGISVQEMRSRTRRKSISCPRSVAMYVARRLTRSAWREIGQYFGGRDHSTVVAASKRVDEWISDSIPVSQPNSCRGTTWDEVVQEIEDRLLSMAS